MQNKVLIIAEAGVNHNGSIELAKKLIDSAVDAKADYVKFQTFKANKLASKYSIKATYQNKNLISDNNSQLAMLQKLELTQDEHYNLVSYCNQRNIKFLSTAFDLDSLDFLIKLNLDLWKIPSGEITNYPYLKRIAQTQKPIILSTGMSDMNEIREAFEVLLKNGSSKKNITILHCNTQYPTPFSDVNLKAMDSIKKEFDVNIGYSDHTLGIEVPIAAVALGARVIEKHFTLDRKLEGPDHKASLEPSELKQMICSIRNIEDALGSDVKSVSNSEKENKSVARKSIVALTKIKKGEIFSEINLTVKRPGSGISPMNWEKIIGQKAMKDFDIDELIEI